MATSASSLGPKRRTLLRFCVASVRQVSRSFSQGWFLRSLSAQKADARKDAHSNLLSKKETSNLYKIQFHNVKPECLEAYNSLEAEVQKRLHQDQNFPCEVVGSWNTWYGEQDQAVHLWRYRGGYPALMECLNKLKANKEYLDFRKERATMLHSRRNQLLLEFSFWNEPLPRPGPNIYEMRTYQLKPGTMIEWGNHWARAIRHRQENNEAVGGFFTQIGDLYVVHHLWAYLLWDMRILRLSPLRVQPEDPPTAHSRHAPAFIKRTAPTLRRSRLQDTPVTDDEQHKRPVDTGIRAGT